MTIWFPGIYSSSTHVHTYMHTYICMCASYVVVMYSILVVACLITIVNWQCLFVCTYVCACSNTYMHTPICMCVCVCVL